MSQTHLVLLHFHTVTHGSCIFHNCYACRFNLVISINLVLIFKKVILLRFKLCFSPLFFSRCNRLPPTNYPPCKLHCRPKRLVQQRRKGTDTMRWGLWICKQRRYSCVLKRDVDVCASVWTWVCCSLMLWNKIYQWNRITAATINFPFIIVLTGSEYSCGEPPQMPHTVIINHEYKELFAIDSEVLYQCEHGYTLVGGANKNSIFCISGSWTEAQACRK